MENLLESTNWVASEIELVYKPKMNLAERPQVNCSGDLYNIFRNTWDENKIELLEQFKILLLNRRKRVLGFVEIASGGITEVVIDARLIFAAALKANALYLVLAHNHPSNETRPSRDDEKLTKHIKQIGDLLRIKLLDHLIICKCGYFSFVDEGLI